MSPIKPISLADQIYTELRRKILTCALVPGERLLEKKLCADLDVSRTSLREALNRLAQERLITLKPNCGYSVTPITRANFKAVCEMRRVLESKVAGLAAKRADEQAIAAMREAAIVDCSMADSDSHSVYCESNKAFHQSIVNSIDNEFLSDAVMLALDKDHQPLFYGIDLEVCTDPQAVTNEHLAIVDAITARQARKAEKLMDEHIARKEQRLLAAFGFPMKSVVPEL